MSYCYHHDVLAEIAPLIRSVATTHINDKARCRFCLSQIRRGGHTKGCVLSRISAAIKATQCAATKQEPLAHDRRMPKDTLYISDILDALILACRRRTSRNWCRRNKASYISVPHLSQMTGISALSLSTAIKAGWFAHVDGTTDNLMRALGLTLPQLMRSPAPVDPGTHGKEAGHTISKLESYLGRLAEIHSLYKPPVKPKGYVSKLRKAEYETAMLAWASSMAGMYREGDMLVGYCLTHLAALTNIVGIIHAEARLGAE